MQLASNTECYRYFTQLCQAIYLCGLCCSRVTLMKSHLWVELLARCQALPCVIPAHIPVTVLLAKQPCLVLQCGALPGSYISFVPAQFLNLSEAQMLQGWTPVFEIKILTCMYPIPYSVQISTLQLNRSLQTWFSNVCCFST